MDRKYFIYIIDDDKIHCMLSNMVFESLGIVDRCEVFNNGLDAMESLYQLKIADEKLPDLIFLDLNMPVMDGWDFLIEFSKLENPTSSIIIVSSTITKAEINKANENLLVIKFISKPIIPDKLQELLN